MLCKAVIERDNMLYFFVGVLAVVVAIPVIFGWVLIVNILMDR